MEDIQNTKTKILFAVTGASGMLFVQPLISVLKEAGVEVHGICSSSGQKVLKLENNITLTELKGVDKWYDEKNFAAPPASGSACYAGMIVLPCSMGTLGAIANGISENLIHRAADVTLKERRKLLLAVRETPFNRIHLENMMKVHDAGGTIIPPFPAYYFQPDSLETAARTFAWKAAAQLGIHVEEAKEWGMADV